MIAGRLPHQTGLSTVTRSVDLCTPPAQFRSVSGDSLVIGRRDAMTTCSIDQRDAASYNSSQSASAFAAIPSIMVKTCSFVVVASQALKQTDWRRGRSARDAHPGRRRNDCRVERVIDEAGQGARQLSVGHLGFPADVCFGAAHCDTRADEQRQSFLCVGSAIGPGFVCTALPRHQRRSRDRALRRQHCGALVHAMSRCGSSQMVCSLALPASWSWMH
jgi:hypothetical protein